MANGQELGIADKAALEYRDPGVLEGWPGDLPSATLAHGGAGIAYFLLRHAGVGGGRRSLDAAEAWAARAEESVAGAGGNGVVGSLYFGAPGVWWTSALVAAARHADREAEQAAARFAAAADADHAPGDVYHGSAGLLLGCAQLVESLDTPASAGLLREAGERLALELAALVDRDGARPGETALGYLGAAHGWAGVAQSLLRWSQVTSRPPFPEVLELLERLIELRRPSGRWPLRAGSREVWLGWCHGSAGWGQLWAQAWQATGDERFHVFAAECAEDAVTEPMENRTLCCGRAGQGFAALTLYRTTGERRWLDAAHRMAAEAVRLPVLDVEAPHQVLNGQLGVALLCLELQDPTGAAMPVYETIDVGRHQGEAGWVRP